MSEYGNKLSWAVGKKTVLCVGTTTIDFVSTIRNFPLENRVERAIGGYWIRGGNASNNCTVLANLGVKVEFFGMLSSLSVFHEVHGIGQAPLPHEGGVDEAGREAVTVPHPIDDLLGLVGGQLEVLALRGHAAGSEAAPGHNDAGSSNPDVPGHPQQLVDTLTGLQR